MTVQRTRTRSRIVKQIEGSFEKRPEIFSGKISTGITLLDLVLDGGLPWGRIVNIVGDSSSGKTFLSLHIVAEARRQLGDKLKWYYDDCEGGCSFDTLKMYKFEVIEEGQSLTETIDQFALNFRNKVKSLKEDEFLIYVIDSWDGLSSREEREIDEKKVKAIEKGKGLDKGSYALGKQKDANSFFRMRAGEIKNKNILLIVVSQIREKIGATFGTSYYRSCERALNFYSSFVLWLKECEKQKAMGREIGITTQVKAKKARIRRPFREAYIDFIFDMGADNILSNINYLYDLKTEKGKDKEKANEGEIIWDGTKFTRGSLIAYIEENDLEQELENRVIEKWEAIESAISSEGRKSKW